jgi:hypothetical protein
MKESVLQVCSLDKKWKCKKQLNKLLAQTRRLFQSGKTGDLELPISQLQHRNQGTQKMFMEELRMYQAVTRLMKIMRTRRSRE